MIWSRIRDSYRRTSKPNDILWNRFVARPLAAPVVMLLERTRVTPNQVTLHVAGGVPGRRRRCWCCCRGASGLLTAVIVLELSYVLDCVDGQLARLRGTSSPVGAHFDFLMDELKAFLLVCATAGRLWGDTGDVRFALEGLSRSPPWPRASASPPSSGAPNTWPPPGRRSRVARATTATGFAKRQRRGGRAPFAAAPGDRAGRAFGTFSHPLPELSCFRGHRRPPRSVPAHLLRRARRLRRPGPAGRGPQARQVAPMTASDPSARGPSSSRPVAARAWGARPTRSRRRWSRSPAVPSCTTSWTLWARRA